MYALVYVFFIWSGIAVLNVRSVYSNGQHLVGVEQRKNR